MRYNINTAMYTGIGIGFGLVSVVFVAGWLVVWLVGVVGGLVYGVVFGVMFRVVWGPMSLVVGLIQWLGYVVELVLGVIGFLSSYVQTIEGFIESLGDEFRTHASSRGHHTPGNDDYPSKEEDTGPATDPHASETDHIDSSDERQRGREPKEPASTEAAHTEAAPTKTPEIESDKASRHRMRKAQQERQGSHDTTDSDGRRESDGIEAVTSTAAKGIPREKSCSDRERHKYRTEFEARRAYDCYVPREEWDSDGKRVTYTPVTRQPTEAMNTQPELQRRATHSAQSGTKDDRRKSDSHAGQFKVSEDPRPTSLGCDAPAIAPTSGPARESPWLFSSSYTPIPPLPPLPSVPPPPLPAKPPLPSIPPMKPTPPRPSSETRRSSCSSKQNPPRPSSHTGNPSRASMPRANGTRTTITIGGDKIQLSRDGEAYILSSTNDKLVRASVNGKPVELERDGQTFKLPKDGGPLRISLDGELSEQVGKPPRNDEQTKLGKNAPTPPALSETDGEKIRPENNDGET
jgi:hypothetical protein